MEDNLDHKDAVLAQFTEGLDRCAICKGQLAVARKAEYSGGKQWPYYYCPNPGCIMFGRDQ
jgi:hypothetical protein